ncbi:MAG: VanZ family protein, partial [Burkholderiaceae bacterium]|nr:VanZ family protein [Burkholderiaceae bacterium]
MSSRSTTLPAWLGYITFVVYGSLVPLNFKARSIEQAWLTFQNTPFLHLGVESRADWIANGVLYLPVGFLTARMLMLMLPSVPRIFSLSAAFLFSVVLAFGVEFAQLFFPGRTVSLNDLIAECIGGFLGSAVAVPLGRRVDHLRGWWQAHASRSSAHMLEAYVAAYLLYSLFPYDLLLSAQEFNDKINSGAWGFFRAGSSSSPFLVSLRLAIEVVLTLPLGVLLANRRGRRPLSLAGAATAGMGLGLVIEAAQLFIATGSTQGVSVLTRAAGAMLGLVLWRRRSQLGPDQIRAFVRRRSMPIMLAYYLLLIGVNGWFSSSWRGVAVATAKWHQLQLIPFYYHYYTTEANALVSLASVWLMYTPVALLCWAHRFSPTAALMVAAFAAGVVEVSKLFLQGLRPDPTNIIIAAAAGWVGLKLALALSQPVASPQTQAVDHSRHEPSSNKAGSVSVKVTRMGPFVVFLALVFAGICALWFPAFPAALFALLVVCAAAVWLRPALVLVIIPAALPVLDLAPWSGRFYWDEFDLLMLACLAVGFHRVAPRVRGPEVGRLFPLAFALLALSLAISTARGLAPWQWPDANSFAHYYSPYNALRIVKGGVWAFVFVSFLRRVAGAGADVPRLFALGMCVGLGLTVGVILWERAAFVGLFDFAADYRVTGPFSAMHKGGAYIECYLAVATPFLVVQVLHARHWAFKLLGALLLIGTTYSVMVTFSRNGFAALAVVLVTVLFAGLRDAAASWRRHVLIALLAVATVAVATPIFFGSFAQQRMEIVAQDLATRKAHWADALAMRDDDAATAMFGMGVGRFPETHFWHSDASRRAGTLRIESDGDNDYLRLGAGFTMYLDQFVAVDRGATYEMEMDVRANKPSVQLNISMCEKWMLTSSQCVSAPVSSGPTAGEWRHVEQPMNMDELSNQPWHFYRPVKLALHSPGDNATVDVDNVRLKTSSGANLIDNGDFSSGFDQWFFSTDIDPPWHIHSLPVAVLFDQGWFGALAWGVLLLAAVVSGATHLWQGRVHAGVALAALAGFMTSGLLNTLIDAPRFLWLLLVL